MSDHGPAGWMLLFKFGRRQHLEQLRDDGLLYLNSWNYFSRLEADPVRSDPFEGTDRVFQPASLKSFTIKNEITGRIIDIPPQSFVGPLKLGMGGPVRSVYCMFAVTEPRHGPFVDERNFGFGDSFLMITETEAFLDKVMTAAVTQGRSIEGKLVEYFDPATHSGAAGPFRKPSTFAYQNEFRFVVTPGSREPLRIAMGSIRGITTDVMPLSEINRIIQFSKEPLPEAAD